MDIHFVYIGELASLEPPIEVTQEELEELALAQARRDKFKENYQKRKANGKQQEYTERYEERRKARYAANKAAVYAEGAVLGAGAIAPYVVSP